MGLQKNHSYLFLLLLCLIFAQCKPEKGASTVGEGKTSKIKNLFSSLSDIKFPKESDYLWDNENFDKSGAVVEKGRSGSDFNYVLHTKKIGEYPKVGDWVTYHVNQYRNGELIFSSYDTKKPFKIELKSNATVPNPVIEALAFTKIGDSISYFIEVNRLPRVPQGFDVNDIIRLELRNLDIVPSGQFKNYKEEVKKRGKDIHEVIRTGFIPLALDEMQSTPSGLKYNILQEGEGEFIKKGDDVEVHFIGLLEDGTVFNDTYKTGKFFRFKKGNNHVINGWEEGFSLLKKGALAIFYVPYNLAYGEAGDERANIPEKANLIFIIETL